MRSSLLPIVLILLLLGLVFFLPRRDESAAHVALPGAATAGPDVAAALLSLPPLELVEPPGWVLSRGDDQMLRALDRLSWGTYQGILSSRDELKTQQGGLADELLARLAALGDGDPILVSKLVGMFDGTRHDTPEVIDELVRRALSDSALISKSALRSLSRFPSSAALGGILDRRDDPVPEVRDAARAALADRARRGDPEALGYVLQELGERARDPDLAYLAVLGEVETDERVLDALRRVVELAPLEARLVALGAAAMHGDQESIATIEEMLVSDDIATRFNAWYMVTASGRVFGRDAWNRAVEGRLRQEGLMVLSILRRAVIAGDESAPQAVELLETVATDPSHPCQTEAIDVLFEQGHPWAVERTRAEVLDPGFVGPHLALTIDRIERGGGRLGREFAELAFERLSDPDLGPVERVLMCRLLSRADPVRAADPVLRFALDGDPELIAELMPYLPSLGSAGLDYLESELDGDRGAGLYIYMAASTRDPRALPSLESIVLDPERDPVLRRQALDCIVRLEAGPREDALRRVATALGDPAVSTRARLLFWNYL